MYAPKASSGESILSVAVRFRPACNLPEKRDIKSPKGLLNNTCWRVFAFYYYFSQIIHQTKRIMQLKSSMWSLALLLLVIVSCSKNETYETKTAESNGYAYEYVNHDPSK